VWPLDLTVNEAKKRFEEWFEENRKNYFGAWSLKKTRYYETNEFPQYFINTTYRGYKGCFIWLTENTKAYDNWYRIEKALTRKVEEGYYVIRESDFSDLITKVDEFLDDTTFEKLCDVWKVTEQGREGAKRKVACAV